VAVDPSGEFSYVTTSDQHSAPATQVIENLISPFRNHVVSIHTSCPANTLTCEPILEGVLREAYETALLFRRGVCFFVRIPLR
jgi:hypothetical protein